jgi:hypothetical protein
MTTFDETFFVWEGIAKFEFDIRHRHNFLPSHSPIPRGTGFALILTFSIRLDLFREVLHTEVTAGSRTVFIEQEIAGLPFELLILLVFDRCKVSSTS